MDRFIAGVLLFFIGWTALLNPPHVTVGLVIFVGCTLAVFIKSFDDGFIGRHLLVFSAIAGMGFAYSGEVRAFLTSYVLLMVFSVLVMLREFEEVRHAKMD